MNWIYRLIAWLVSMGVLREHQRVYWVSYMNGFGKMGAGFVWTSRRMRTRDDVMHLEQVIHSWAGGFVTVLSWRLLPSEVCRIRRPARPVDVFRGAYRDRGSTPWWAPLLVVALVVWAGYVVTSTLSGGR